MGGGEGCRRWVGVVECVKRGGKGLGVSSASSMKGGKKGAFSQISNVEKGFGGGRLGRKGEKRNQSPVLKQKMRRE